MLAMLRKLLGRDDKFFALLEASANEAHGSVQLLGRLVREPQTVTSIEEFSQMRKKDKKITEEITEQLCRTFVTPLEREDIEALSTALYKIPKTVGKFSERYLLCRERLEGVDFTAQVAILEKTTAAVVEMVHTLRQRPDLDTLKWQYSRLNKLEGEADKLMLSLLGELYTSSRDPLQVLAIMDLSGMLEKAIDRCRDAGNVVFQIVLKYS